MTTAAQLPSASAGPAGLAALDPPSASLLNRLDRGFESWGLQAEAQPLITAPLLPVTRLAALDYYRNFPHQAMVAAPLRLHGTAAAHDPEDGAFPAQALESAQVALPPAACYGIYLHLAGQALPESRRFTVVGRCFRREEHYEDLRRLLGFHMREIVAIGTREYAEEHLEQFSTRVQEFAARLGLPLRKEAATDPFYDRGGSRALMQRLSPVKYEFLFEDLAIASVNVHRNFFGERCGITLAETEESAFTSCVAFGLERWLSALHRHFGDWERAAAAVEQALAAQ